MRLLISPLLIHPYIYGMPSVVRVCPDLAVRDFHDYNTLHLKMSPPLLCLTHKHGFTPFFYSMAALPQPQPTGSYPKQTYLSQPWIYIFHYIPVLESQYTMSLWPLPVLPPLLGKCAAKTDRWSIRAAADLVWSLQTGHLAAPSWNNGRHLGFDLIYGWAALTLSYGYTAFVTREMYTFTGSKDRNMIYVFYTIFWLIGHFNCSGNEGIQRG